MIRLYYTLDTGATYTKFENMRLILPDAYWIGYLLVPDGNVTACEEQCNTADNCKVFNYNKSMKRCNFRSATRAQGTSNWRSSEDFDAYEKGRL